MFSHPQNLRCSLIVEKTAWAAEILFLVSTGLTKLSILLFYRRLLEKSYSRLMQWAIYIALALTTVSLISFVTLVIFSCSPINAAWKSLKIDYKKKYTCLPRNNADPIAGLASVISDVYALVIPQLVLRKLQIPRNQKIVLNCVFGCGWM